MGRRGHADRRHDRGAAPALPAAERPDLVISGINRGDNMGENVFYSGTVGAAMEAAINHVPALAISVAHRGPDFRLRVGGAVRPAAGRGRFCGRTAGGLLLNVNVPLHWKGGVRFTRQSKKMTRNVLQEGTDPRGGPTTG